MWTCVSTSSSRARASSVGRRECRPRPGRMRLQRAVRLSSSRCAPGLRSHVRLSRTEREQTAGIALACIGRRCRTRVPRGGCVQLLELVRCAPARRDLGLAAESEADPRQLSRVLAQPDHLRQPCAGLVPCTDVDLHCGDVTSVSATTAASPSSARGQSRRCRARRPRAGCCATMHSPPPGGARVDRPGGPDRSLLRVRRLRGAARIHNRP